MIRTVRDAGCARCSLHEGVTNVCISARPLFHPALKGCILFVGEGPGREEDERAQNFVGPSGTELQSALLLAFPNRPVVFTNVERCFPRGRDIEASGALEACLSYLEDEISLYEPSLIVALGEKAAKVLAGMPVPILAANGGGLWWRDEGPFVRYLMHPAFVLRNMGWRPIFRQTLSEIVNRKDFNYKSWIFTDMKVLFDIDQCVTEIQRIKDSGPFAFDVETTGRMYTPNFKVLCLGLGNDENTALVLPEEVLGNHQVQTKLRELFTSTPGIAHNWKFDAQALASIGVPLKDIKDPEADTLIWAKLMFPLQHLKFQLNYVAHQVGMGGYYEQYFLPILKKYLKGHPGLEDQDKYQYAPRPVLWKYNACDVITTFRLYHKFLVRMSNSSIEVWNTLYKALPKALAKIESRGMFIDGVESLVSTLEDKIQLKELVIRDDPWVKKYEKEHGAFNPASTLQLGKLFHEVAKVPIRFKTEKDKPRLDRDALEAYSSNKKIGSFAATLIEKRTLDKMLGTYGKPLASLRDSNRRVRGHYGLVITGRLSCSDPNLQNIPVRTELGKDIRKIFCASPGRLIVSVDLSQIELRVSANLSGDSIMIQAYIDKSDLHLQTAAYVYSMLKKKNLLLEPKEVIAEERRKAKTINFKLIYGGTSKSLSRELGIDDSEAASIINLILGRHKKLAAMFNKAESEGFRTYESWTFWNGKKFQRRFVPEPDANIFRNNPIQGSAAHYMIASINAVDTALEKRNLDAFVVATVHDEILMEAKEEDALKAGKVAQEVMTSWDCGQVPLEAEIKLGKNWGELKVVDV